MNPLGTFLAVLAVAACGSVPCAAPEQLTLSVRRARSPMTACPAPAVLRGMVLSVERRAFEVEDCPRGSDCRASMRARFEIVSESLPDLRTVLTPMREAEVELQTKPGTRCGWHIAVTDLRSQQRRLEIHDGALPPTATRPTRCTLTLRARGAAATADVGETRRNPATGERFHVSRIERDEVAYWIAAAGISLPPKR